jgi:hypothetical protein
MLRSFACSHSPDCAGRARGHPPGAHAGPVGAASPRQLRCAARPGRARITRCANCVRSAQTVCASQMWMRALRARLARALRCSPTQKSPLPGAPCRDGHRLWLSSRTPPPVPQRTVRAAGRAHMERRARTRTVRGTVLAWRAAGPPARRGLQGRAPQGSWPRAQRAPTSDSPHVSERSERSSRSELCGGPRDRGAQGSLRRRRRPRNLSAAGCPHGPLLARTYGCVLRKT